MTTTTSTMQTKENVTEETYDEILSEVNAAYNELLVELTKGKIDAKTANIRCREVDEKAKKVKQFVKEMDEKIKKAKQAAKSAKPSL